MLTNDVFNRAGISHSWTYWDDAFTDEELTKIIDYCETLQQIPATVLGTSEAEKVKEIRSSDISWVKREEQSNWIFDRINAIIEQSNTKYYGFDLYGYDSLQYTTYSGEVEGRYDWHMDSCLDSQSLAETRKLSLTLLLDDRYEGGEFQINTGQEKYEKTLPTKKGRAIIFPSFIIHRVKPVTRGERKSLVAWCVGPKFK